MRFSVTFLALITTFSSFSARAETVEHWTVKSVQCLAGTVDASKTYEIGSSVGENLIRGVAENMGPGSLQESDREAELLISASGDKDGMCKNAGDTMTIQIIKFTKN